MKSRLQEWEDAHENLLAELLSSDSDEASKPKPKETQSNAQSKGDHQA